MSDAQTPESPSAPEAPSAADELKNLKAEFNRKLENQNSQMQQLLNTLQQQSAPKPSSEKVSVFVDEDAYAKRISDETERRIEAKMAAERQATARHQSVINSIVVDYPEANDTSSELYKRANEIYASLDEEDKRSSLSLKTAVAQAAAEQGLKPKSKRQQSSDSDSFAMSGTSKAPSTKSARKDIDAATESFAAIMGLNLSDPKVRERLASRKPIIRR